MPKTIWVRPETYRRLDALREKRESFSDIIDRLCRAYETIKAIPGTQLPPTAAGSKPTEGER